MKKTLIALFALAGVAAAANVGDTLRFGSYIDGTYDDAVATLNGMTRTAVNNAYGASCADNMGYTNGSTFTLSPADVYPFTDWLEDDVNYKLTTVQILSRSNDSEWGDGRSLLVSVDGGVTNIASEAAVKVRSGSDTYGLITVTFSKEVLFTDKDTLTFTFVSPGTGNGQKFGVAAFKDSSFTTLVTGNSLAWTVNNNTYVTPIAITAIKTPEPATATLSLLALAGLAARRRRH